MLCQASQQEQQFWRSHSGPALRPQVLSWESLPEKEFVFATLCFGALIVTFSEEQVLR